MKKIRTLIAYFSIFALALSNLLVFTPVKAGQAGTTLSASKTATGSWTRTFGWTINKSVSPDNWNLFNGDTGTSEYTVALTKDNGTDAVFVEGEICVTNGGSVATENLAIEDELRDGVPPPNDLIATVNVDLSANPVLDPGESYCYPYKIDVPSQDIHAGGTYKNTANVTITNHSGHLGEPFGPSPSTTTTLPLTPTLVNDTVTVDDTNGSPFPKPFRPRQRLITTGLFLARAMKENTIIQRPSKKPAKTVRPAFK